jgi:hypothetical protein
MAVPDTAETVPVLRDGDGTELAKQIKPGMSLNVDMDGVRISLPLPNLAAPILGRIDGIRSLAEIHSDMVTSLDRPLPWEAFTLEFDQLYSSFYGLSRMFLRKPV